MKVDTEGFMRDGYVILLGVVPPDELDALRVSYETLVNKQRAIWALERQSGDPPGGLWDTHQQPRLNNVQNQIDISTANAAEVWLKESTMGVSQQLMRAPEVAVTEMMLMCNPVRNHPGGTGWHRDFHPRGEAPLEGLEMDLAENGPSYVQWNIPLYDDSALWIVPGSHRRRNTEEEELQMRSDPKAPLPGSIPVELKAGDGVAYTNLIWHSGLDYRAGMRRTIHGGHCSIGGQLFPYVYQGNWDGDMRFTEHLSPEAAATMRDSARLFAEQRDLIEAIFKAVLTMDAGAFHDGLARLHPGEKGRMVCLVSLSKVVIEMRTLSRPEVAGLPPAERRNKTMHRGYFDFMVNITLRFSLGEIDTLGRRFATLDASLQADTDRHVSWAPDRPSRYVVNEMPDFEIDDFIASW